MYEVELKANITAIESDVLKRLREHSSGPSEREVYFDKYFDTPNGDFSKQDRELRLRSVSCMDGRASRSVLTCKDPPFDESSKSKVEYETLVGDPSAMETILTTLGFVEQLAFEKRCEHFKVGHDGYDVVASVVTLPDISGVFLEVEIQVAALEQTAAAKGSLVTLLRLLGVSETNVTAEYYTDLVRLGRKHRGH